MHLLLLYNATSAVESGVKGERKVPDIVSTLDSQCACPEATTTMKGDEGMGGEFPSVSGIVYKVNRLY